MKDIMLDLETMGSSSRAAIVAIGAVKFDPILGTVGDEFYMPVDLQSSVNAGLVMDPGTVLWWLKQTEEARAMFKEFTITLPQALERFSDWIMWDDVKVWGNGAAFDNVILMNAYAACGMPAPWKFYNDRCYRTMKALNPAVQMQRVGTHHNALDDARSQAQHLIDIMASRRTA